MFIVIILMLLSLTFLHLIIIVIIIAIITVTFGVEPCVIVTAVERRSIFIVGGGAARCGVDGEVL